MLLFTAISVLQPSHRKRALSPFHRYGEASPLNSLPRAPPHQWICLGNTPDTGLPGFFVSVFPLLWVLWNVPHYLSQRSCNRAVQTFMTSSGMLLSGKPESKIKGRTTAKKFNRFHQKKITNSSRKPKPVTANLFGTKRRLMVLMPSTHAQNCGHAHWTRSVLNLLCLTLGLERSSGGTMASCQCSECPLRHACNVRHH